MRKYFLVLVTIFALCLFTGIAVAQSQSSTSPNSETQGTIHNGQATNPGDANASTQSPDVNASQSNSSSTAAQPSAPSSDQAGQSSSSSVSSQPSSSSSTGVQADQSNSSVNSSTSSTASSDMSAKKTMEGCLVKENADYFIQPVSGDREKLNSTEDLSSKVNKQVRVEGTEQSSMASNASSSSPGASSSTSANSNAGTGSAETQNNSAGSIAGNAGSSNASGTGASASSSNAKEFQVTKIETVSESCPAGASK